MENHLSASSRRWRKLRAATLIFILYNRRTNVSSSKQNKYGKKQAFFYAPSNNHHPNISSKLWLQKKQKWFQKIIKKSIQNRSDADIKLLSEFLRNTKFFSALSIASIDAIARRLRFCTFYDGEIVYYQGDAINDCSCRYMVIEGSFFTYKNVIYTKRAREGENYIRWFQRTGAIGTTKQIKYGECVDTSIVGDTFGEDALNGCLFRDSTVIAQSDTVVACLTQLDYKRVIRFNVENENQLLDDISYIVQPPKDWTSFDNTTTTHSDFEVDLASRHFDRRQIKYLLRFLNRYECFRALPIDFCAELVMKMRLKMYKPDEVLCHSYDQNPKMFLVLNGKVCVYSLDSIEEIQEKCVRQQRNHKSYLEEITIISNRLKDGNIQKYSNEASKNVVIMRQDFQVDLNYDSATHICTLTSGDAYGENCISQKGLSQGTTLINSSPNGIPCVVLLLSRENYLDVWRKYLDKMDLNSDQAYRILTRILPRDRTEEQIAYLKHYFSTKSESKLFFNQLPRKLLDGIFTNAFLESHKSMSNMILYENEEVEYMRIILSGEVGVYRPVQNVDTCSSNSKATLQKQRTIRIVEKNDQEDHSADEKIFVVEPMSILKEGSSFGQLQIFTNTRSAYYYRVHDSTNSQQNESTGSSEVKILAIPARYVQLALVHLDEYILYNPSRVLNKIITSQEKKVSSNNTRRTSIIGANPHNSFKSLNAGALFYQSSPVYAFPHSTLDVLLESMQVVCVPAKRVLFEHGESMKGLAFIVLSGHVRTLTLNTNWNGRKHASFDKDRNKPGPITRQASVRRRKALISSSTSIVFEKEANDAIFTTEYVEQDNFIMGDCFGKLLSSSLAHHNTGLIVNDRNKFPATENSMDKFNRRNSNASTLAAETFVHVETAVTMTESYIGVISSISIGKIANLREKLDLISLLTGSFDDMKEASRVAAEKKNDDTYEDDSMNEKLYRSDAICGCNRLLTLMGLTTGLSPMQKLRVAHAFKRRLFPVKSTIVYKQGEEASNIYLILGGRVRLYLRSPEVDGDERSKTKKDRNSLAAQLGECILELGEGDIFGDEAFFDEWGDTRRCTALAEPEENVTTEFLVLSRQEYDSILSEQVHLDAADEQLLENDLSNLTNKKMSSTERWQMAIYQVIQRRARRSQWTSVMHQARDHRINLIFDLLKKSPMFLGIPFSKIRGLCINARFQHFASSDTIIFSRDDQNLDMFYFIIEGSVNLQQPYSYIQTSSNHDVRNHYYRAPPAASAGMHEMLSGKTAIKTLCEGKGFGEFEILHGDVARQTTALVNQPGTKLILIPRKDFEDFWPDKKQMKAKILFLEQHFHKICNLDSDQLCSLYYVMERKAFKRNDVVAGSQELAGHLHIIESGVCIVHECIPMQEKRNDKTISSLKLSLDTKVSSLLTGAVIFSEISDLRKQLSVSQGKKKLQPNQNEDTAEYIVADSPVVSVFSVQLFPSTETQNSSDTSQSRFKHLLALAILGKSGLREIHESMDVQRRWRAKNAMVVSQIVEGSLPRKHLPSASQQMSRLLPRQRENVGLYQQIVPSGIMKRKPLDLSRFLKDRELTEKESTPCLQQEVYRNHIAKLCDSPNSSLAPSFGSFSPVEPIRQIANLAGRSILTKAPVRIVLSPVPPEIQLPLSPQLSPRVSKLAAAALDSIEKKEIQACMHLKVNHCSNQKKKEQELKVLCRHGRPPRSKLAPAGMPGTTETLLKDPHGKKKSTLTLPGVSWQHVTTK